MFDNNSEDGRRMLALRELRESGCRCTELTAEESLAMLMSGGIRAIEVWILTTHEAALFVV